MIFEHTYREPRMWRGWFKNGQSLEVSWGGYGWSFGGGIGIHSDDADRGSRHLQLYFWKLRVFIPLGLLPGPYQVGEEPQWSFDISHEFGIWLRWGHRSKRWDFPFHRITLAWDYETSDGWRDVKSIVWDETAKNHGRPLALEETHPYRYVLRTGQVQEVEATIHRERWVFGRHILSRLGWPSKTRHDIDIRFSGEVGERAGSWKGGTIGCDYEMLPEETPLQTLRRMERERVFS